MITEKLMLEVRGWIPGHAFVDLHFIPRLYSLVNENEVEEAKLRILNI